ncbi:MAG: NAD(P)-dependent oxidoreductase [Acidimicrobiia bacterium]|jgi:nucleoside-diphosphate-sugar epimerase
MGFSGNSVLVTGALGCIGSWTVSQLVEKGIRVVALDPSDDDRRLEYLLSSELMDGVRRTRTGIGDLAALERIIADNDVDRIIHLAALQLPFCRADPPGGALVNVVGTVNVFEAARRAGVAKLVYASSVAVFDQQGGRVEADTEPRPTSHYGVYKLANEGTANAYWHEFELPSIGIRPMTVYGPGRDRGLTSSPTRAILAAVLGCSYEIGFGGTTLFQYARDVASALVAATEVGVEAAQVINLNGVRSPVADVVAITQRLVGPAASGITVNPRVLPFPDDVNTDGLDIIGIGEATTLEDGVASTLEFFEVLRTRGVLDPEEHGLFVDGHRAVDVESARVAS